MRSTRRTSPISPNSNFASRTLDTVPVQFHAQFLFDFQFLTNNLYKAFANVDFVTFFCHKSLAWLWRWVSLGVSMGRSGSGLCPTRDRPDRIGLRKSWPAADRWGSRIGAVGFAPETRSVRSESSTVKKPAKIVDFRRKTPNPAEI